MKLKKILFGEKTPDKDDPEYQKLREESEAAGLKISKFLRLDKAAAAVQRFAERHTTLFFGFLLALSIIIGSAQIRRIQHAWQHRNSHSTAVERQRQELHFKRHQVPSAPLQQSDECNKH
jgi:hypothetical protein